MRYSILKISAAWRRPVIRSAEQVHILKVYPPHGRLLFILKIEFSPSKKKNDAGEKRLQWTISARTTLFWLWFSHDIDFLGKKGLFSHCFSGGNIDTGGQSATEPGATWCTCTCQWKGARNTCTTSKKTSQLLNLIIEQSQSIICVECLAKYLTESTTWRLVNAFTLRCQPSNVIKTPAAEFAIFSCFAVGRNLEDGHLPLEPDSTLFC